MQTDAEFLNELAFDLRDEGRALNQKYLADIADGLCLDDAEGLIADADVLAAKGKRRLEQAERLIHLSAKMTS